MANGVVTFRGKKYLVKKGKLEIRFKKISDIVEIDGLDKFTTLKELILDHNKIKDIRGLDNLTQLNELDLRFNEIREIKGLEHLINLKKIHLKGNPIRDDEKHLVDRSAQEIVRYCQEKTKRVSEEVVRPTVQETVVKPVEVASPPGTNASVTPSTAAKKCQSCGLSIEEGTIFCPHCGAEL